MKICPNCGSNLTDDSVFCTTCGTNLENTANFNYQNTQAQFNQQFNQPYPQQPMAIDPKDHTAEFDAKDISDNKVIAMLPYLAGFMGIIVALLSINHSEYVAFHLKQALKITVCSLLLGVIAAFLCFTFIVPIAAGICFIILFVVRAICFFNVCKGKAKEAPIVSNFAFLK